MRNLCFCYLTVGWGVEAVCKIQENAFSAFRKLQSQEGSLDSAPESGSLHSVGVDAIPFDACQRNWYCVFIRLAC